MDKRTNEIFEFRLDSDRGVLHLDGLLMDTLIYLYDDHGDLQVKAQYIRHPLAIGLSKRGAYVLVMLHPISEIVVRRFFF